MRLIRYPFVVLLASVWGSLAWAQPDPGVYAAWDRAAGAGGASDRTFDCGANTGQDVLVFTFVPSGDRTGVDALSADISIVFAPLCDPRVCGPVPRWWQMQPGGCRQGACAVSNDFSGPPFDSTPSVLDAVGSGSALWRYTWPTAGDYPETRALLHVELAFPASSFTAGQEYYAFRVDLSHVRSQDAGACEGCCVPMYLGVQSLMLSQGGDVVDAFSGAEVAWQRYSVACDAVPAHTDTWGHVKTLYR